MGFLLVLTTLPPNIRSMRARFSASLVYRRIPGASAVPGTEQNEQGNEPMKEQREEVQGCRLRDRGQACMRRQAGACADGQHPSSAYHPPGAD